MAEDRSWQATVTARTLNVRGGPGDGFPVVGTLARGDIVEAVDEKGGWIRLKDDQPA
ncbi:MAG: SH3 domain-containing protein [Alphaproteobacteria bacterium]|nr:SH3 domain-containing protein [Alphaproteobacteria bacterium]